MTSTPTTLRTIERVAPKNSQAPIAISSQAKIRYFMVGTTSIGISVDAIITQVLWALPVQRFYESCQAS